MTYKNISIQGKDYLHNHFRFVKGSNLTMYIYPNEQYLELIFLRGTDSFQAWLEGCKDCYIFYAPVPRCSIHRCRDEEHTFQLNVNETDDYYFVVNNPFQKDIATVAHANVTAHLDRVIYICSQPMLCYNVSRCDIRFDPFSQQAALVEYLLYDNKHAQSYVSIACQHRPYMYVIWFVVLPGLTWILISVVVCCRRQPARREPGMEMGTGPPDPPLSLQETLSDSEMTCATDERLPFARFSRSWEQSEEAEDSFEIPDELVNHI